MIEKIETKTCPHSPWVWEVMQAFERGGFTRLIWKCPDCGGHWRVYGTRWSKTAYPVRRAFLGLWVKAN